MADKANSLNNSLEESIDIKTSSTKETPKISHELRLDKTKLSYKHEIDLGLKI
jgi:hypothetical protein